MHTSPPARLARPRTPRVAAVAGALAVAVALPACAGDSRADAGTLRVYSGRHYDVELAFEQFSDETGVDVEFLTGNDAELRERIAAEGEDTEADVYLTVDAGNLAAAAADGIFQPLDDPDLVDAIPAEYRDPDSLWFGLALRARTIVYSTERMTEDEVPTTYAELADPAWQGRLCLRNSNNDYQQSLVASMIAAEGEDATLEVLEGWADNADIYANDVELLRAIAAGACDVGVANHYYLAREIEEDPDFPVGLVWAEQESRGVHVNISGGGVTKYADNPDLAQRFLTWLATDGQDVFVASNHEYPANPAVEPEPLITERFGADFARDGVNAKEFGELNADAVALMDEADFG
jgi:iron(III) transport system substrate-binding protein